MKGKALYNPNGKANEYSQWAVNFFTGCSNDCDYCYLKRGVLSHVWDNKPHLKKVFTDYNDALKTFEKELLANRTRVRVEGGVFFSFSTDPCLPSTFPLTRKAALFAIDCGVPVTILTKVSDTHWLNHAFNPDWEKYFDTDKKDTRNIFDIFVNRGLLCIGFTLTGHDEMENGASTNELRISGLDYIHSRGIKTFASIEPVIDFKSSLSMIRKAAPYCDLFKIGLMSGVGSSYYDIKELESFMSDANDIISSDGRKVYWKDSIRKYPVANKYANAPCSVSSKFSLFH